MLLFPVHWRITICAVVAVLLMIAAGYWQKYQRSVARYEPGTVADNTAPPVETTTSKTALVIGPRAVLREPAPDYTAGQTLRGTFRARFGPRAYTFKSVSFTPDGLRLVASGNGPAIPVWELQTGEESHRLPVFASEEESLLGVGWTILSPDGRTLVSASGGGREIWLWDLPSSSVRKRVKTPSSLERAVFTPDSRTLFVSLKNDEVQRWDASTGESKSNSGKINNANLEAGLAVTPDGNTVVIAMRDGSLALLDGETLQQKKRIPAHSQHVQALALSPDGKTLATVTLLDGELKLWNLEKTSEIRTVKCNRGLLTAVAFSPSGKYLAAGGPVITLWDVKSGAEQDVLVGYSENVNELAFSPDGMLLAGTPNCQRGVVVWELTKSLQKRTIPQGEREGYLALASGGSRAARGVEKSIELRDLLSGKVLATLTGEDYHDTAAFSPAGNLFAFCKSREKVVLADDTSGAEKAILDLQTSDRVQTLAFRPDGKRLAVGAGSQVQVWECDAGKPRRLVAQQQRGSVNNLAFHPNGKLLALAVGPALLLVDAETGKPAWTVPAHEGPISTIAFSADGGRILTVNRIGPTEAARVWNTVDGKQIMAIHRTPKFGDPFRRMSQLEAFFADDDRAVVMRDEEGVFSAWDAGNGKPLGKWKDQKPGLPPVFAPDRKTFLTSGEKTFHLWETAAFTQDAITGRTGVIRTPPAPTLSPVYAPAQVVVKDLPCYLTYCAFSMDGNRLASVDGAQTLTIWNPATGKAMKSFPLRVGNTHQFALSADGRRMAAGCQDNTVRLVDLDTGKEERLFKGHSSFRLRRRGFTERPLGGVWHGWVSRHGTVPLGRNDRGNGQGACPRGQHDRKLGIHSRQHGAGGRCGSRWSPAVRRGVRCRVPEAQTHRPCQTSCRLARWNNGSGRGRVFELGPERRHGLGSGEWETAPHLARRQTQYRGARLRGGRSLRRRRRRCPPVGCPDR